MREIGIIGEKMGGVVPMLTAAEQRHYPLNSEQIGKRIKLARKEMHQTQEYLASLCNCTPTHICNIENGKIGVSLELLFKISVILEKSMDYFVMDHPNANPQTKINTEIAPKLAKCDPQMLDMVDNFLDGLIAYRDTLTGKSIEENSP